MKTDELKALGESMNKMCTAALKKEGADAVTTVVYGQALATHVGLASQICERLDRISKQLELLIVQGSPPEDGNDD